MLTHRGTGANVKQANLLPFALAVGQAMVAVAISTVFFFGIGGKKRLVLLGIDLVPGVTTHAERIDFQPGIHNVWRCAVAARGPGFVGNVLVRLAMATRASDIGACMDDSNILLHVVYVTDEAPTIVNFLPV